MAPIVSGTMAAVEPMVVPTSARVSGVTNTSRMMNGIERIDVDDEAQHLFSAGRGASPCGLAGHEQQHAQRDAEECGEQRGDPDHVEGLLRRLPQVRADALRGSRRS